MADSPTTVFTSASTQTSLYAGSSAPKRKRKPAGTPDPDAAVIALSPQTLMESDRYICEICNQGFQRDQNLQMHRRRHKVPWKLLKRIDPEVRKRVYICPEPSCLHHSPRHALGDLVGIKKHYRRKHSCMKQWECEKCSKAYAVQSDYKAHIKTCGTRGHCCDCGRVFSRVESFIEHQDTCTAARNKKGSASSDLAGASLPSLVQPAAAAAAYPPSIMPTTSSHLYEEIIKDDCNHHNAASELLHLPKPGLYANDHDHRSSYCTPLRQPLPLQISPSLVASLASPHAQATQDVGSIAGRQTQHHSGIPYNHLMFQHHRAELQLLPTSKLHLNQLESSQGSVTLGITSTNSTNSGCTCCSPLSKLVNDKHAHEGTDCPRMLRTSGAASACVAVAPCKLLQLSIGLSDIDNFAHSENQKSMHKSRSGIVEETNSETLGSKAIGMPWLHSNALPVVTRGNDTCQDVNDTCQDVPDINIETPKSYSSLCSTTDPKHRTPSRTDGYNDAAGLELASSAGLHLSAAANLRRCNVYHNPRLEEKLDGFIDQNISKKLVHSLQYEEVLELLQGAKRSHQPAANCKGADKAKLFRCKSSRESIARLHVPDQQCISLSRSIEETDRVSEVLQYAETPSFSLGTSRVKQTEFLQCSGIKAPAAAGVQAALEALVEEAREKLKRASEEKLEAEKAWIEARREREQAEEERSRAQRIAEYNNRMEVGAKSGKPNCSSSTLRSSPNSNSLGNCQASSPSFQIRQLHAGSTVLCSASSFITCPSCHHTSQILYPPPNKNMC